MLEQKIRGKNSQSQTTSGKYKITEIHEPKYQEEITRHESGDFSYF